MAVEGFELFSYLIAISYPNMIISQRFSLLMYTEILDSQETSADEADQTHFSFQDLYIMCPLSAQNSIDRKVME